MELELLPPIHPNVTRYISAYGGPAPISFYPVRMDIKQAEAFRTQFIAHGRTRLSTEYVSADVPVFTICPSRERRRETEEHFCCETPDIAVFFDLDDRGRDRLAFTDNMWRALAKRESQVLYVRLQVGDSLFYRRENRLPSQFHVLSVPMLLGGSRFHITEADDFSGDNLFSKIISVGCQEAYTHDWCWVGAITSEARRKALAALTNYTHRNSICRISAPGHTDAMQAATPYDEFMELCKRSKVNVSLNGNGVWCLKDGELLSTNCFILRQAHPTLSLCPLSPKDGQHWVVASTGDLVKAIEHYLNDDIERERIKKQGHELMHRVLFEELWSKEYVSCLESFIRTRKKESWGGLAFA